MSEDAKRAAKRFARVFVAGALVGGWAALKGDMEFAQYLIQYGWAIPVVAFAGKFLRDKLGWKWLPF